MSTKVLNIVRGDSIKTQLLLWCLLIALVPLLIVAWISYNLAHNSLSKAAEQQLQRTAASSFAFINNWFDYRVMDITRAADNRSNAELLQDLQEGYFASDKSLENYVSSFDWHQRALAHQQELFNLRSEYDYIYDIFLIDLSGNVLFSLEKEAVFGTNLFVGPYASTLFAKSANKAINKGDAFFSDFERFKPSGNIVSGFITRVLLDEQGNKTGIVAFQIWLDRIKNHLSHAGEIGAVNYLVGEDGYYRTSPFSENDVLNLKLSSFEHIQELAARDSEQAFSEGSAAHEYLNHANRTVFGIVKKINILNIEWLLISEIERNIALQSALWLRDLVIALFLITTVLVISLAVFIAGKITNPIIRLTEQAKLATEGHGRIALNKEVNNEVGELTEHLQRMLSARKKYEHELLIEKNKAEQASQAKSEFLACMSHEIRTPMNGVLGMLRLALNQETDIQQRSKLSTAMDSAQSLLSIINDILDFSKVEAGKLEIEIIDFNVIKLFKDVNQAFKLRCEEKGLELVFQIDHLSPVWIAGDPSRLRQILTNLISNAIKFTHAGKIIVKAEIVTNQEKPTLFCSVTDTGIGIPEDKTAKLFDSFSQVDSSTTRQFGGTGLGLAICKKLANLMEGDIEIESQVGMGSTFKFFIALQHPTHAHNHEASPTNTSKNPDDYLWPLDTRILVVEDNQINQSVVEGMLDEYALQCDFASDGADALTSLNTASTQTPYCLVFMDCQMPIMDGYEATQRIRKGEAGNGNREISIVAMTANAMQGDKEKCLAAGMNDYLAKPLEADELLSILYKYIKPRDSRMPSDLDAKTVTITGDNGEEFILPENPKALCFDKLPRSLKSKPERLMRILNMFVETSQKFQDQFKESLEEQSAEKLAFVSHSYKGACGNLALQDLYDKLQIMESNAKANQLPDNAFIDAFQASYQLAFQEIERCIALNTH